MSILKFKRNISGNKKNQITFDLPLIFSNRKINLKEHAPEEVETILTSIYAKFSLFCMKFIVLRGFVGLRVNDTLTVMHCNACDSFAPNAKGFTFASEIFSFAHHNIWMLYG